MMNKSEIRQQYRELRKSLGEAEVESLSARIRSGFLEFLENKPEISHIHIFIPITLFREINTLPLLKELFQRNKKVYTSSLDLKKDFMQTLKLDEHTLFQMDSWGIPVPVNPQIVDPNSIQLVLVPLLAFDQDGHRLGYGKGYYDKFLKKLDQKVIKVGLSLFPPTERLPKQDHDIPLDFCVTPDEIFEFH